MILIASKIKDLKRLPSVQKMKKAIQEQQFKDILLEIKIKQVQDYQMPTRMVGFAKKVEAQEQMERIIM